MKHVKTILELIKNSQEAINKISAELKELGQLFTDEKYEISLVGGPVRDAFLGIIPHDFDLTTSAKPEATEKLLRKWGASTWDIGKEFGTIGEI